MFERRVITLQKIADKTLIKFGSNIAEEFSCKDSQHILEKINKLTSDIEITSIDEYFSLNVPETLKKLFDPFLYEAALLKFDENTNTIIETEFG